MTTTITVRGLDPRDKSWLKREAKALGVSMESLVRRFIQERRQRSQRQAAPVDVFRRYFGPEHGVELLPRPRYGYRPVLFDSEEA